jgi:ribonuclease D
MHQHILSIVNFVLAAPAVREILHEARDDVIVPVFAHDVEGVG